MDHSIGGAAAASDERKVPVTLGSARARILRTDSCVVTDASFPPGTVLGDHRHEGAILATMLAGSFTTTIGARRIECTPSTTWTEPAEETHANRVGSRGARVLVVQLDRGSAERFQPFERLVQGVATVRDPGLAADARRIAREVRTNDAFAVLAIESLVLTMLVSAARTSAVPKGTARPPAWLGTARDIIRAEFRRVRRLADLAAAVGVHPSHLAHEFRRHFRCSVGEYARRIRLEWALAHLRDSRESVTHVALAAGYCDQAHFTRECTRAVGVAPAGLRAMWRRDA